MDEKRGIGKANALMWHIPGELPRFKRITTGHPIIMGRKTYESIGRVLPNRTNIIITRDRNYTVDGAVICGSLEQAIEKAKQCEGADEMFIIGGGQIFTEALEKRMVHRLYLTLVKGDFGADTFFPEYQQQFPAVLDSEAKSDDTYTYTFETRQR